MIPFFNMFLVSGGLVMKNDIAKIGTRADKDTWVISKATSIIKLGVGNDTFNSIIPQCSCQTLQVRPYSIVD